MLTRLYFLAIRCAGAVRRHRDRVQERLRPVCDTAVLLYGGVWVTYDLSSHAILKCVQSGMPDSLQLCLWRRHQHFHLQRRQLCHHFLSYRYTSLSILSWFAFLYQRLWSVAFNLRLHLVYCSSITLQGHQGRHRAETVPEILHLPRIFMEFLSMVQVQEFALRLP